MRRVTHQAGLLAILVALMMTAAACSSDDQGGSTAATGGATGEMATGTTVDVTLQEFGILPAADSAAAGDVTFDVTNQGPKETHEFVVIKTDLAPDALPTKADGSVDEEADGLQAVDEIEDIGVGDTPTLTVSLAAGSYVFICNIVDEEGGKTVSHYQQGMVAGFAVQ